MLKAHLVVRNFLRFKTINLPYYKLYNNYKIAQFCLTWYIFCRETAFQELIDIVSTPEEKDI